MGPLLAIVVLVAAGCFSSNDTVPGTAPNTFDSSTSASATSSANANSPSTSARADSSDGISVEEAEKTGVLTGEFDALLIGPESAHEDDDGCLVVQFLLRNAGSSPDSYRIESDSTADEIDPDFVELHPDQEQEVLATVCDETSEHLVVEVFSTGLGDVVARYEA